MKHLNTKQKARFGTFYLICDWEKEMSLNENNVARRASWNFTSAKVTHQRIKRNATNRISNDGSNSNLNSSLNLHHSSNAFLNACESEIYSLCSLKMISSNAFNQLALFSLVLTLLTLLTYIWKTLIIWSIDRLSLII